MILPVSPDAPLLVRVAADTALFLHIGGGSVGLVSGAVAVSARKGARLHRAAGNVFFVSMLTMSGIGAIVAPMLPERISAFAGLFTFYLIATAWATVRRPEGRVGRFEVVAMLAGWGVVAGLAWLAAMGAASPRGLVDRQPYQIAIVFAAIAALAAGCDLDLIRRGGVSGAPRIARHLWRMCLALFIAAASFFLGQQKVLPEALRGSPLLFVPALAPLVLLAFWLLRVRFTQAFKPAPAA